jgi:hypothetical protein
MRRSPRPGPLAREGSGPRSAGGSPPRAQPPTEARPNGGQSLLTGREPPSSSRSKRRSGNAWVFSLLPRCRCGHPPQRPRDRGGPSGGASPRSRPARSDSCRTRPALRRARVDTVRAERDGARQAWSGSSAHRCGSAPSSWPDSKAGRSVGRRTPRTGSGPQTAVVAVAGFDVDSAVGHVWRSTSMGRAAPWITQLVAGRRVIDWAEGRSAL